MKYDKYGIVGDGEKDIRTIYFAGTSVAYIEYNNGKVKKVELPASTSKHQTMEMTKLLRSVYPKLTDDEISKRQKEEWFAFKEDGKNAKQLEENYKEYQKEKTSKAKVAVATGLGVLGIGIGVVSLAQGCAKKDDDKNIETKTEVTTETVEPEVVYDEGVILEGKTPEEVMALLEDGTINKTQADFFLKAYNWLKNNALTEDWEKVTLTDEEIETANKLLTEMGYDAIEGKEARFGYTIEEAMGLMLRFGNYSKEELTTILGGENIDVEKIMNDESNSAIRNIILYLVYSDECKVNIGDVVNFSDEEMTAINEINGLWKEYKDLLKAEKEKEAEAKMHDIKVWLINFGSNAEYDNENVKGYILRTYLYAADIMSNAHNYKEDVSLHVLDTNTNTPAEIKVNMPLMDELTMRTLATGFKGFDVEEFKKEYGINDKYVLTGISDIERSKADESCGEQEQRLVEYNQFVSNLRTQDLAAESSWAAVNNITLTEGTLDILDNAKTDYDKYTDNTASIYDLAFAIDAMLESEELTPVNMQYYQVIKLSSYIHDINVKVNPMLGGKIGDVLTVIKQEHVQISREDAVEAFGEDKVKDAEEDAAHDKGAITEDELDDKVKEDTATLQQIYESVFNYFAGEAYFKNTIGYNGAWESSADPLVKQEFAWGREDGLKYKEDKKHDGEEIGGDYVPVDIPDDGLDEGYGPDADEKPKVEEEIIDDGNDVVPDLPTLDDLIDDINDDRNDGEIGGEFIPTDGLDGDLYISDDPDDLDALLR